MERDLKQNLLLKKPEEENEQEELSLGKRVWNETKLMWVVAAPAIFTRFSTFGIQIISQAFVGHIGSRELAAFALVFTVLIRFANGILVSTSFSHHFSTFFFDPFFYNIIITTLNLLVLSYVTLKLCNSVHVSLCLSKSIKHKYRHKDMTHILTCRDR